MSGEVPPIVKIELLGPNAYAVGDTLRLRASLTGTAQLSEIEIYIDGRIVKRCSALSCDYSEALTTPGLHRCWAVAKDVAGNIGHSEVLGYSTHSGEKRGPWLDVRIQPYSPTSRDVVRFMVRGRAPGGVERIILYVNNREVAVSDKDTCEYTGGPYPPGDLVYRIFARGRDGSEDQVPDQVVKIND
jgi:hypothetical protein